MKGQTTQPPHRRFLRGCLGTAAAVVVLIVTGIVLSAIGAGKTSSSSPPPPAAAPPAAPPTPAASTTPSAPAGIGWPVRDGKFQFTITAITHAKEVGDVAYGLGETAQGRFTILHVNVTNIGGESQSLDDSAQYVYDAAGRKFDASSSADIDINDANGGGVFLNDINPGNTVHGLIAFDLPVHDKAVKAEFHDSIFSLGVTVSLRRQS